MKSALRRELAFIRRYVAPPESASLDDILSSFEVARLFREEAHFIDLDQAGEAAEMAGILSRHRLAVLAAWRTGNRPEPMMPKLADSAALEAGELDNEDGIDY